jgi:hypothetical protein
VYRRLNAEIICAMPAISSQGESALDSTDEKHSAIADPLRACRSDDDTAISI